MCMMVYSNDCTQSSTETGSAPLYGLQYPAKLRVSHNSKEFYFTDPDKAVKFAESNFEISGPV